MSDPNQDKRADVRTYLVGYAAALALTGEAFAVVRWPGIGGPHAASFVLGLALVQIAVHFRCFLHITLRRSTRDDLRLILFSTLIIALMVAGTLVVLANLDARMM